MINFKEKLLNEADLYQEAHDALMDIAKRLNNEDVDKYREIFNEYAVSEVKTELARISYSKNFEIEDLFYFDQASDFHIYVMVYVYAFDEDHDKDMLCSYTLMFDENLESIDDFIG
ncbi:hypothetical protein ACJJIC_05670 [Microbulbifer sp. ANSA002]|uniref:hypothetical protein n=1 Tax=unclassified Microbulbifer TaxID=2619833 RepID=UPI0040410E79